MPENAQSSQPVENTMPSVSQEISAPETVLSVKKGPGLAWLLVVLLVVAVGAGAYAFYSIQKPVEESVVTAPRIKTQEEKRSAGFESQTTTAPSATPTLTASDTVSNIEKDLSGTALEAGNTAEFDADLQAL